MRVREHLSLKEAAEEEPILAESARVAEVSAMDCDRREEVVDELVDTLDTVGNDHWEDDAPESEDDRIEWVRELVDGSDENPLTEYIPEESIGGKIEKQIDSLYDRYTRSYPSLLRIRVETDEEIDFIAGQYIAIRFEGTTRVYSVASSPTREDVEFCIRRVPGGDLTTKLTNDLEEGDEVSLRGPYGEFVMEQPSGRDLVFLATGTGVAPLKSMIDYLFEEHRDEYEGEKRDIWLFLGSGWEDDLAYRETFREMDDARDNFHFVPTLSRENYLSNWEGETAYVQYALAKYLDNDTVSKSDLDEEFARMLDEEPKTDAEPVLNPESMEVYACGINAMVYSLVDAVDRMGVPEEHTQFEGFG